MRKRLICVLVLCFSVLLLMGCMNAKIYTIRWDGWQIVPKSPVVNQSVLIDMKYFDFTDGNKTVVYHWVITEGENQKTFITMGASLRITFDTPGLKEVFLWAEGVNYGDRFESKPYFFEFNVAPNDQ